MTKGNVNKDKKKNDQKKNDKKKNDDKKIKKEISNLKKTLEVNNKKLKILKLTDNKSKCSNTDLTKLLSDDNVTYEKWPSYKCNEFIPNSSVLTYENAKNSCNANKNCKAIYNKNCDKKGFRLCSSSVLSYTKDCGCVYLKKEGVVDQYGNKPQDIKHAISKVEKDVRCPSSHPFRSNLKKDLNDSNDHDSGNVCFNTAGCAASKASYYNQIKSGLKCDSVKMTKVEEKKDVKKKISKLQKKQIVLDYKINRVTKHKNDLITIAKEKNKLINILNDDLKFKKKDVKNTDQHIERKKKQVEQLEKIKKTHLKSLDNVTKKERDKKLENVKRIDKKIEENKKEIDKLGNDQDKKIKNILNLTEKILKTKKDTIKSKNDIIIVKANIKKDKKIKDSIKNKEDYIKLKFKAQQIYDSSIKTAKKIEEINKDIKKLKKRALTTKDKVEKEVLIKGQITGYKDELKILEDELFNLKKEHSLIKNKLDLIEKKRNINIKEAKIIKEETELKKEETKIKMTKKEDINSNKLANIISEKKKVLKEKENINKNKKKIIEKNLKINKENKKIILEKKVAIQKKIINIKTKMKTAEKINKEFDKLKKKEKIAEEELKKLRKKISEVNKKVEIKSTESKELVKSSKKLNKEIKNLNKEIAKNKIENIKLKKEIKSDSKDIKKAKREISLYDKTLKAIQKISVVKKVHSHYKKNPKPYFLFFIFFVFMLWAYSVKKDESEVLNELIGK